MAGRYWVETLGCPKNQVDSIKLVGVLEGDGYQPASRADRADLVVVNTCAFIEAAREESIETILALSAARQAGSRLVVTGCMAERYGQELADALPEVDQVAGFGVGVGVSLGRTRVASALSSVVDKTAAGAGWPGRASAAATATLEPPVPSFDLLNLPRPPTAAPWAYVKVAEGCDRHCGFCAIPSFRGPQRSRTSDEILSEVDALAVQEVVLVAQDLVSWGRDARDGGGTNGGGAELVGLLKAVQGKVERVRLLYLYPSGLSDDLIEAVGQGGCPYFDLSLQHVSRPLLRRMRRFGDRERFLRKISTIRRLFPDAAFRSSFIVGYPGETERDHDTLLGFLEEAQLDWAGFFAYSAEEGTYAKALPDQVPGSLMAERARECSEAQDAITAAKRLALVGTTCQALVDAPGHARSHREAPEIDGCIQVPLDLVPGAWVHLEITDAIGPDVVGVPVPA